MGGGATGARFIAAPSCAGRPCAHGGGAAGACCAISGHDVVTRIVPRAPANSRCRRTANEWVMMLLPNDNVGFCWKRGRRVAASPPIWTDRPADCVGFHALNAIGLMPRTGAWSHSAIAERLVLLHGGKLGDERMLR